MDVKKPTRLQRLARWNPGTSSVVERSQSASSSEKAAAASFLPIEHENLVQGSLYIVQIHHVTIALFEGWDDDMCCFSVLRSTADPMRWSEARYIPGDFEAYNAFDHAGNPPVHLWTRYLRVSVPINWFAMFEEARRKQREWMQFNRPSEIVELEPQRPELYSNPSTAAASTNIVDPALQSYPSVSSLPTESKPLGLIDSQIFQQQQNGNHHRYSDASFQTFPNPPSSPGNSNGVNRDALRKHLTHHDDDKVQVDEFASFPHDSDKFSIHSVPTSPSPPSAEPAHRHQSVYSPKIKRQSISSSIWKKYNGEANNGVA
ncbi:hypothetical protein BCR43DRAFT_499627 [Syncephalastrum racemosum]|uniref:Uncharacterized protein n=1 Tax=Syncephalastrum racemosum TaxID=13706 RepID=A0A1X2H0J8_SYNRA|nr:hypothetical protein BCR43DRAFT_499627 [Syncephalastrum racemosum]